MQSDGSIVISTELDNKELQRQINQLSRKIKSLDEKIYSKRQEQMPLVGEAQKLGAALDEAKAKLDSMQNASIGMFSTEDIKYQRETVASLQAQWNGVQGQVERYDTSINKAASELDRSKERAGELHKQLAASNSASNLMGNAIKRAGKHMDTFKSRLASVVRSALIFTVITQALAKFRDWMGKVISVNAEASAAMSKLKGALLTLAQPLVNVIIPAFTTLANILARVVAAVANIVSALFGTTIEQSREAAEALYQETDALGKTGEAAKKAGNNLAGFDEVNKLSGDTGGGGANKEIAPNFSDFSSEEYKSKLDEIGVFVSGALLALGAILTFSGANILLGLALMAVGAVGLVSIIATNWNSMSEGLTGALTSVFVVLGGFALCIGAVLAFTGANIPLGIGLMVLGAASLGTAIALNWNAITEALQGPLGELVASISIFLLGIGMILVMSGAALPLGIALIAVGAVGLVSMAVLNWNAIIEALRGPLGETVALVSGFLLAIGLMLALSGVALPLGIALIAAGAIGLATVVALNWDSITTALQGPLGKTVAIASAAMLALGIILCLSGVGLPLGIALIAAGAAGLVTVAALNWDAIVDKLKEIWGNIKNWWNTYVAKFFTLDYWKGLGKDILDGLFNGIAGFGSKIKEWGNGFINGVKDFFGIHSPSTEFEALGGYMMSGLEGGVTENTGAVESVFSVMFSNVVKIESSAVTAMQNGLAAFLKYMATGFVSTWSQLWDNCHAKVTQSVNAIISEINSLNAKLASIQRNITITISTVEKAVSGGASAPSARSTPIQSALRSITLPVSPLATGAVIPPNREFMAVLGDQRHGTNIEAPEDLIRKIVHDESGNSAVVAELREILAAIREGKVMMVDRRELGRVTREELANASRSGGYTSIPVR